MGRPLRIEYPGAFYHVTSRGNERRAIFLTQKDYERMIGYLESATERYGAQIIGTSVLKQLVNFASWWDVKNICPIIQSLSD